MGFGLFVSTVGALAFNRQRRIVLGAVLVLVIAVLLPRGRDVFSGSGRELLDRLEAFAGPAGRGLALPPPGDGLHGGASLARAGRLVACRAWPCWRHSGSASWRWTPSTTKPPRPPARGSTTRPAPGCRDGRRRGPYRTPIPLPMLPWWGGVGPALWRQLATAVRFPGRFFMLLLLHLSSLLPLLLTGAAWSGLPAAASSRRVRGLRHAGQPFPGGVDADRVRLPLRPGPHGHTQDVAHPDGGPGDRRDRRPHAHADRWPRQPASACWPDSAATRPTCSRSWSSCRRTMRCWSRSRRSCSSGSRTASSRARRWTSR